MRKKYPDVLKHYLEQLASENRDSTVSAFALEIDHDNPSNPFELMVSMVVGHPPSQPILDAFRAAKFRIEDPMDWADLLGAVLDVFSKRRRGVSIWSKKMKAKLVKDCIAMGCKEQTLSISKICEKLTEGRKQYKFDPQNLKGQISRFELTEKIRRGIAKRAGFANSSSSGRRVARSGARKNAIAGR